MACSQNALINLRTALFGILLAVGLFSLMFFTAFKDQSDYNRICASLSFALPISFVSALIFFFIQEKYLLESRQDNII